MKASWGWSPNCNVSAAPSRSCVRSLKSLHQTAQHFRGGFEHRLERFCIFWLWCRASLSAILTMVRTPKRSKADGLRRRVNGVFDGLGFTGLSTGKLGTACILGDNQPILDGSSRFTLVGFHRPARVCELLRHKLAVSHTGSKFSIHRGGNYGVVAKRFQAENCRQNSNHCFLLRHAQ